MKSYSEVEYMKEIKDKSVQVGSDFLSQGSLKRSSDPHGHISCLERQDKVMRFRKEKSGVGREIS